MPFDGGFRYVTLDAFPLELAARIQHGRMLGARRDDVTTVAIEARHAEQREVVRLGGARSPDDLVGRRTDERCDLGARLFDARARTPAGA